jgi:hypothetical protein
MQDRGELSLPVEIEYERKKAKDLPIFTNTEAAMLGGIGSNMTFQAT